MKTALKRLQGRVRDRWYLAQARRAIARCNRNVGRRRRTAASTPAAPQGHYFAPGVIEGGPRAARRGLRPYVLTLAIALASAAFYLVRGVLA